MRYHIKENAGNTLAEKQKQKPHTHVIWDDMNMEFKGGWNRISLVEMHQVKLRSFANRRIGTPCVKIKL
jgi:hypothetical protein